jgi:hypothetical protein
MRIPLIEGNYQARSVIADCQRAVNLYAEANPKSSLVPFSHYNAPGLTPLGAPPTPGAGRCLYWGNNGQLYGVVNNTVYAISPSWAFTALGTIGTVAGFAYMADNGTTAVVVDGSSSGYQINLTTNAFSAISSASNSPPSPAVYGFYGATRVDMLDGFMIFNQPGTRNFYCTYDNEIVFDSTYFAAKNGYSDPLVTLIVSRREIWLIGRRTSEIWFDAGGTTFPFQLMPGPFVQHGCTAPYSVAQIDGAVFWLSHDQAGNNIVVRGEGYLTEEISNPALTNEWDGYLTTEDAQGFCFQLGAHKYYQINFPAANKSWRWDSTTRLWHEPVWTDPFDGTENRHRASVAAFAYGVNVCLDWQTGQLYQIDPNNWTDAGAPMYFRRGFPHIMDDGKRVIYPAFTLDIEAATSPNTQTWPGPFPLLAGPGGVSGGGFLGGLFGGPKPPPSTTPMIYLRWSDTRGKTWSQPVPQSIGATGKYLTQPKWSRLGMGRDRVFEVYGVVPGNFAINGAFLEKPVSMAS